MVHTVTPIEPSPSGFCTLSRLHRCTVKEIAARLHLGTPGSASVCLLTAMNQTRTGDTFTQVCLEI